MNILDIIERMQSAPARAEPEKMRCPDCGRPMIKRKSKWGDGYWYGCSGFPDCKKTMKDIY
jgi:ssDNA-binding Zn-finger/Zn-ribbon topoisomerase 1